MIDRSSAPRFDPAFEVAMPAVWRCPLLFNSPHSGSDYPPEFLARSRLNPLALRKSEDFMVDQLFASALGAGAPLIKVNFPRAYLDVNREPYELDPRLFTEKLPGFANSASVRVAGGLGTIPRVVCEGEEIYRGPLVLSEALQRIEMLYRPYHRALAALVAQGQARFGPCLLVDCHSMPSSAAQHGHPEAPDIVLGDRFGVSAAGDITALAETLFRTQGFSVVRNKPYAGGFIAQSYADPRAGRHVLQIEINRALYMNERTVEPLAWYPAVAARIGQVVAGLSSAIGALLGPAAIAAE